jgi:hypothetical protein
VKNVQWAPEIGKEHWAAAWAAIAAVRSDSMEVDCDFIPIELLRMENCD